MPIIRPWKERDFFDDGTGFIEDMDPDVDPNPDEVDVVYEEYELVSNYSSVVAGKSKTLRFRARDQNGNDLDLTDIPLTWVLSETRKAATRILEKAVGSGITQVSGNIVDVALTGDETADLEGKYSQELYAHFGANPIALHTGIFEVFPSAKVS